MLVSVCLEPFEIDPSWVVAAFGFGQDIAGLAFATQDTIYGRRADVEHVGGGLVGGSPATQVCVSDSATKVQGKVCHSHVRSKTTDRVKTKAV